MKQTRVPKATEIRENILKHDLPNNMEALEEYAEDLQGKYTVKSPVKTNVKDWENRNTEKKQKPDI